jgi:hypothetical protein
MSESEEQGLEWYQRMHNAYKEQLTPEEKSKLHEWEEENLGREEFSTSDWPGWEKHIGLPPWRKG